MSSPALHRRRLPRAAGGFYFFGYGEEQFFLVRVCDQLQAYRQGVGGNGDGDGDSRQAGEIEPLRKAHGVSVTLWSAGLPGSFAVAEGGGGGDGGEQEWKVAHLEQNFCAEKVALGTGGEESVESDGRCRVVKIIAKNGA